MSPTKENFVRSFYTVLNKFKPETSNTLEIFYFYIDKYGRKYLYTYGYRHNINALLVDTLIVNPIIVKLNPFIEEDNLRTLVWSLQVKWASEYMQKLSLQKLFKNRNLIGEFDPVKYNEAIDIEATNGYFLHWQNFLKYRK